MKFSANISTLFKELPFLDRFDAVRKCGITAIEVHDPYSIDLQELKEKKSTLKVDLINSYQGDGHNFGVCCIPGEEIKFLKHLSKSIEVAFHLECPKIHIYAGLKDQKFSEEEQKNVFVQNLITAADVLEEHNITGLIEPICAETIPNYFLDSFVKAVNVINEVGHKHIKLLLDIYHLHKISGNVMEDIKTFYPYAGHIQVSQDPGRTEPFHPGGSINYTEVFKYFKEQNYDDFIGLEYFPSTENTLKSLEWIQNFN